MGAKLRLNETTKAVHLSVYETMFNDIFNSALLLVTSIAIITTSGKDDSFLGRGREKRSIAKHVPHCYLQNQIYENVDRSV